MANPERILLVDGTALIYRAFFAIPPHFTTAAGLHTNAIYGFATMFRKMFAGRRPDRGAVVFDAPGKTFRDEKYPAYKAQRPSMADDLREQLSWIDRVVEGHRFPILRVAGYEADDVIGTLTRLGVDAGMEVVIVSGDKDFCQLVSDRVKMVDSLRDITYDTELVRKKWGVRPEQMVDLLAIMGDKIDNIPGVPGIGQKGAAQLLEKYGSLDGILANVDELKGRQKSTLEDNRDQAKLSQDLATIDRNTPLSIGLDDMILQPVPASDLNDLYRELEFYSLLSEEEISTQVADAPGDYRVATTVDDARTALASIPVSARVAVLAVYDEPTPVTGDLAGIALSWDPQRAIYLPLYGRDGLGDAGRDLVGELFGDPKRLLVTYNVKFLWTALHRLGVELCAETADVMLQSYVVDPTKLLPQGHQLEQLVKEYLHRTVPPAKGVVGSGRSVQRWTDLESAAVGPFACLLVDEIGQLHPVLTDKLETEEQRAFLTDVELPLARILGAMELTGIRVDPDDLSRIGEEFRQRLNEYEKKVFELAGREFNIGSPKQLSAVLFDELKLPVIKRTKSGYSTNAEVLERLAPKHEIAHHLLEHRKLAKLINTYTDVLQRAADPVDGRIHTTFQQAIAATGRIITTDPDLQRTPVKTPEGRRIRQAFVAPDEMVLLSADWSQIELRLLAHFTGDERLVEAFRNDLDVHRRTAGQLFDCAPDDVTSEQRGVGKLVNFATIYGQGATALGQILGVPRKEAQRYIDGYFEAYHGVRDWLDFTIASAHDRGYVTTILGRRRYIPELVSRDVQQRQFGERVAANTPIQGSAADLCKLAMLRIAASLEKSGSKARMLLQVHDELVFELPPTELDQVSALVRDAMENVYDLRVPLVVDVGHGRSWADAH